MVFSLVLAFVVWTQCIITSRRIKMATRSASLGTWHQAMLLVLHLFFLYILGTMQEHVWQVMPKLQRRVVERHCVGIFVYHGLYFGMYDSLKPVVLTGGLHDSFFASFLFSCWDGELRLVLD
ncbi:hypothetical protein DVH24_039083 [Malus domestica]|uniref:Uncharacterized protein n=1 Tax=Malus domestica TaxID=3750 RepID=A0A498K955_MALDO|nr:hypothetical protein DVH24_039083 [Malus domestica]